MQNLQLPLKMGAKHFVKNKRAYYTYLRNTEPVHKGKFSMMSTYFTSRYADCVNVLKDSRVIRDRRHLQGGRQFPIPLPKSVDILMRSMINQDDPNHRRLRTLVHKAFTPKAIRTLGERIDALTQDLLDKMAAEGTVDLLQSYALPIPVTVIREMVGVNEDEMEDLQHMLKTLIEGLQGVRIVRTLLWDISRSMKFTRKLIARKRREPGDDMLTAFIQAEEDGERLTEDEIVAMTILLVIAGHETTVGLINNFVVAMLQHPEQHQRLKETPELIDSAIEEVLRYTGPVIGTELNFAAEDIELHGVTIPKKAAIIPILGAANFDPTAFDNPDIFDIARTPNKHLGFGQGIHYCLGAPLARLETKIAVTNLFERFPNLQLAVPEADLQFDQVPLFNRYKAVPVVLK